MNPRKKAQKILSARGLIFQGGSVRGEYTERAYVAFAEDGKGKKYVLKLLLVEKEVDKKGFLVEEAFLRSVKEMPKWKVKGWFPKYMQGDVGEMPYWFLTTYAPGQPAGEITVDFGWRPGNLVEETLEQVVEFLKDFQVIRKEEAEARIPSLSVPDWEEYFLGSFSDLPESNVGFIGSSVLERVRLRFKQDLSSLKKPRLVLAHSDLYPKNAFLTEDHRITIIDLDHLMLCNPGLDAAFFWVMGWRDPSWQGMLRARLIEELPYPRPEYEKVLDLMIMYLSLRLISHGLVMKYRYEKEGDLELAQLAEESMLTHRKNLKRLL